MGFVRHASMRARHAHYEEIVSVIRFAASRSAGAARDRCPTSSNGNSECSFFLTPSTLSVASQLGRFDFIRTIISSTPVKFRFGPTDACGRSAGY